MGLDVGEDVALQLEVLGDGLNDEVRALDGGREVGRPLDAVERRVALLGRDLLPVDAALEVLADALEAGLDELRLDVPEGHLVARHGADLGDAVAHRARAEYGDVHVRARRRPPPKAWLLRHDGAADRRVSWGRPTAMWAMHGVVPAAGEGTRLRPLTEGRPKPLVEVAGRPLLAHVLDQSVELGVEGLVVIVGYEGDQVREAFGDAHRGVPVAYVEQPEPVGLADAVRRAEPHVDGDFVVMNGDNVFDADLSGLLDRHREADADATLLVDEATADEAAATGVLRFDDDGALEGVVEKPVDPPSTRVTRGCYVFSPVAFHACHLVRPSARGEHELSDAVDLLLAAGRPVETVGFEGRCVNVNTPEDLEAAAALVGG